MLAGRIGERTGLLRGDQLQRGIKAAKGRPVILEGGITSAEDIEYSAKIGAAAVLVNSAFQCSDPIEKAKELRVAADKAWSALATSE